MSEQREVSTQPIRGRYAPSPTGDLHMGNLRTALLSWLFVRRAGGKFVLRIEDLDRPRVRPGALERMIEDLYWLGLDWDEGPDCGGAMGPYIQSERLDIYQRYFEQLLERDLLYPCYCTRAEVAHAASAPQQGASEGPRYPGTCRNLTMVQRRQLENQGRRPSLRLRVDDQRRVFFTDLLVGLQGQHVQYEIGDFIVRRADGIFSYQFAVVVDDGLMNINQVVRGVDLLSSTARQILLFELFGFSIPTFAHVPLIIDETGKRLSKRTQSMGLAPLREAGKTPEEVIGMLAASCQLIEKPEPLTAQELCASFGDRLDSMLSSLY